MLPAMLHIRKETEYILFKFFYDFSSFFEISISIQTAYQYRYAFTSLRNHVLVNPKYMHYLYSFLVACHSVQNHTRPRLPAHGQEKPSPRCHHTKQHTNCNPNRSSYELPYCEQQVRWHTKHTFHCSRPGPTMALRIQYGFHYITREIKQTHKERYAGLYMYNYHRLYISCINTTFYMYWSINDVQQLKITTNTNGNVYILILAQLKFYRVIKKSLCTWWLQYTQVIWRWPSQNTFGMWTVLYWTRSSRTRFGVSINVRRVAGDTSNTTCNFLYCNHQVHRDFSITLYIII
jgi:hypothetical protein